MLSRLNHTQLLRYAGLFTWAVVGIPLVLSSWYFPGDSGGSALTSTINLRLWVTPYLGFGISYWLITRSLGMRHPRWYDYGLLLFASLSAIVVSHSAVSGFGGLRLLVVPGVWPWHLPWGIAASWRLFHPFPRSPLLPAGRAYRLPHDVLH